MLQSLALLINQAIYVMNYRQKHWKLSIGKLITFCQTEMLYIICEKSIKYGFILLTSNNVISFKIH